MSANKPSETGTKVDNSSTSKSPQNKPPVVQPKPTSKVESIIGMIPINSKLAVSKNFQENAMLIMTFAPCKPKLQTGLTLFTLENAWEEYTKLVGQLGFSVPGNGSIKIACTAESLPGENFSNEYGNSFLSNLTDTMSGMAGEITQITGHTDAYSAVKELNEMVGEMGTLGQAISSTLSGIGNFATEKYIEAAKQNQNLERIGRTMNRLLGGNRVDFPKIWKSSTYSPTYSVNVKLYNPSPASKSSINKYIIGPLAAILSLATPIIGQDGETFSYPFISRINCPGLFNLNAGSITSITVDKGGSGQLIGFNQIVGMVDVRIEFMSLFETIVNGADTATRPTIKGYLDNLAIELTPKNIYSKDSGKSSSSLSKRKLIPPVQTTPPPITTEAIPRVTLDDIKLENILEAVKVPDIPQIPSLSDIYGKIKDGVYNIGGDSPFSTFQKFAEIATDVGAFIGSIPSGDYLKMADFALDQLKGVGIEIPGIGDGFSIGNMNISVASLKNFAIDQLAIGFSPDSVLGNIYETVKDGIYNIAGDSAFSTFQNFANIASTVGSFVGDIPVGKYATMTDFASDQLKKVGIKVPGIGDNFSLGNMNISVSSIMEKSFGAVTERVINKLNLGFL